MYKKIVKSKLLIGMMICGLLVGCTANNQSQSSKSQDTTTTIEESVVEDNATDNMAGVPAPDDVDVDTDTSQTTLTYIGHASVKIVAKDGSVLLIDPNYDEWKWKEEDPDVVLVTHSHSDHAPNFNLQMSDECQLITYKEALHQGEYESYDVEPFHIEAVPAGGNPNHDIKYCVGYLVTVDGITVYHAGDTSMIDQMADLKDKHIDYAMYPIDGVYNMDAIEATEVANLVGAVNNIPIHELDDHQYDDTVARKSEDFTPDRKLVIEYGETIVIGE